MAKNQSERERELLNEIQQLREKLAEMERTRPVVRGLEAFLTQASIRLISLESGEIDEAIKDTLTEVGAYTQVDRAYVFLFAPAMSVARNTHEWCAPGIEPQIQNLQAIPKDEMKWWIEQLQQHRTIHIPSVKSLPENAQAERELLEAQGIQSVIAVPLIHANSLLGFAGFDSVRTEREWTTPEIRLLRVTADIIANALSRKQAEESLRESEERYRSLIERMLDGVYRSTHAGRFVDINPAMAKMFGYASREELLQVDIKKELYFDPQERGSHILDSGQQETEVYRMRRKDGTEIWVEDRGYYVHGPDGEIEFHEGMLRDVTERVQAEIALRNSEARNRAIIAAMPDLLFQINAETRFIDCRASDPKVLIRPPEQVIGKLAREVLPPDLAALTEKKVKKTLKTGKIQVYQYSAIINGQEEFFESRMTVSGPDRVLVLVRAITQQHKAEAALKKAAEEITKAYDATLRGWSNALELREHETAGHSRRVVKMTLQLAREMGISEEELVHVERGALLHDIGKMGIPDHILLKPGPLTADEWTVMRQHPEYSYRMLADIEYLQPALDIPYCHHEHWDGSGYPRQLKEEEIPLAARVFSVVDAWDALSYRRPYRPGWTQENVINHLQEQAGKRFDPQVVETFIRMLNKKTDQ